MSDSLGYHLYHFKGKLPERIEQQFHDSQDVFFLKKPLRESIQTANIGVDVDFEPSEKTDVITLKNNIIFRRFFKGSILEQVYIGVPVDDAFMMKDEGSGDFQKRIIRESHQKLMNVFGVNYAPGNFNLVSSIIIFLRDEKVFSDNKSCYESISQFMTHSYKIKSEQYVNIDNYQIVVDYEGIGIIFSSNVDLERVNKLIFVSMLVKAYLATLEAISLGTVEPLGYSQSYFKEAKEIEKTLDSYNRFLIRYYYHNPIMVDVNKTFYIYEMIKDVLKLREQYNESKEQVRILSELSNTKRIQISEMRNTIWQEEKLKEKKLLENFIKNINQLSKIGLAMILIEFFVIVCLLLFR